MRDRTVDCTALCRRSRRSAAEGARVAIVSRTAAELDRVVETAAQNGEASVTAITADVTDQSQVEMAVSRAISTLGGIDLLVNILITLEELAVRFPWRSKVWLTFVV